MAQLSAGATGVIHAGGLLGPIGTGHWEESEVPVPVIALSNGAENTILMLSQNGAVLPAGTYTLHFSMDRDRWQATTSTDPLQHYHFERSIVVKW